MGENTFDASKNYKKICYRADRDLLNTELNESQDIELHERRILLDKIFAPGTIIQGLIGTVDAGNVAISDGIVYLDGCAVNVPGTTLSFAASGEYTIYVDVFRREITASDDPALVNPLTGEPTAEREKWITTLQTRDTTNDPLPEGAISRTVTPVYIFNRDTGELRPYFNTSAETNDIFSAFTNHAGHGGIDRHPAVSMDTAGFMTPEQMETLESIDAVLPTKADDEDLVNLSNALSTHRTSTDHDNRYYTETESDNKYAPISHVGIGGNAHQPVTTEQNGFMSASDKIMIGDHESRIDSVESVLPEKANNTDVTAISDALITHKSSADHDSRYYTETESDSKYAPLPHVGSGGIAHSVATVSSAGFMDSTDKSLLNDHESRIVAVETILPGKADDTDVIAISDALLTHKSSSDHDSRYYTESESDVKYAPIAHVGSAGYAHSLATPSDHGFISKQMYSFLRNTIHWQCIYDYNNDASESMVYGIISTANGIIWRNKCDADSTQRISTKLRSIGTPINASFEFYHMTGNVSMETGPRVSIEDWQIRQSRIPGGKIYNVLLYPDSFTNLLINVTGTGDVCFSLDIFPGDDRQICWDVDSDRDGKPIVS
ncbi:MAG: DUF4815 domain-containing protein [Armatimonadota bacterium]